MLQTFFKYLLFPAMLLSLIGCKIPYYDAKSVHENLREDFPTSKHITLDHKKIHYVETKSPSSNTLVIFIHGSPGGWEAYGDYLKDQELRTKARLISVDRLGFGQSETGIPEKSLKEHAKVIAKVIKTSKAEQTIVVGHSYGGPVAARLTMDYPELVQGLILIAPSISPEQEKRRWYNELASWKIIRWALPDNLDTSNREILPLRGELKAMLPLWKNIKAPVTVIQGEKDRLVPKENADFAQNVLTNTEPKVIRVKKQGHFVIWEQYDLVKTNIIDMLCG